MATRAKELSDLGNLKLDVTANGIDVVGVGSNFKSESYNILNVQTDTDDSGSSDDGIFKITNGSAGTTKAEFRWDESEDLVHVSYGDHGRHISIASDGNVGIGTSSVDPGAKLEVADSDGGISVFINNTQSWSAANLSEFNNTALVINPRANGAQLRFSGSSGDVRIQSLTSDLSTAEDISLNPFGGNVGIGNTDPQFDLHLNESVTIPNGRYLTDFDGTFEISAANHNIVVSGTYTDTVRPNAAGLLLHNDSNTDNTFSPAVAWGSQSDSGNFSQSTAAIAGRRLASGAGQDANWHGGELHFYTAVSSGNGLRTRMVIDDDGNVGIGTTGPEVKLEVNGGADGSVVFGGRSDGGNGNNRRFNLIAFADGGGSNYGGGLKIQTRDDVNVFHDRITVQSDGAVGIQTTSNKGLYIGDTPGDYSAYGTGVPTIDIRGTVAANRRAGAITFRENDDTLAGAIYSTYGGDGYAGLNFHSNTEAIKFAVTGAGGSPATDIVTIEGSSTKSRLNVNYLANVYNGGLGGVYAYNGFIGANEVSASGSDNDSNVRVRVCIENSTSVWRSGYCWVTAASTDTNGSGATAAWYLYSFRTYNSNIGAVTLQDSGGATSDYTVAFSDDGDPDGDGTSLVIGVKVTAVGTGNQETVMGVVLGTREGPPRAAERISG